MQPPPVFSSGKVPWRTACNPLQYSRLGRSPGGWHATPSSILVWEGPLEGGMQPPPVFSSGKIPWRGHATPSSILIWEGPLEGCMQPPPVFSSGKIPWRRACNPLQYFHLGRSPGGRHATPSSILVWEDPLGEGMQPPPVFSSGKIPWRGMQPPLVLWSGKIPWRGACNPLQYSRLGRSRGRRGLAGYSPWNFPGKNTKVGCHGLLQDIFPTQGSNLCLLLCRFFTTEPPGKPFNQLRHPKPQFCVGCTFWATDILLQ